MAGAADVVVVVIGVPAVCVLPLDVVFTTIEDVAALDVVNVVVVCVVDAILFVVVGELVATVVDAFTDAFEEITDVPYACCMQHIKDNANFTR